jgi:hypothetical protein
MELYLNNFFDEYIKHGELGNLPESDFWFP